MEGRAVIDDPSTGPVVDTLPFTPFIYRVIDHRPLHERFVQQVESTRQRGSVTFTCEWDLGDFSNPQETIAVFADLVREAGYVFSFWFVYDDITLAGLHVTLPEGRYASSSDYTGASGTQEAGSIA